MAWKVAGSTSPMLNWVLPTLTTMLQVGVGVAIVVVVITGEEAAGVEEVLAYCGGRLDGSNATGMYPLGTGTPEATGVAEGVT